VQAAASAFANCRENSRATKAVETLTKQYPSDTILNFVRKPSVLAVIAMRAGKNDEAIRLLEPGRRIELGVGPGSSPALVPYVRGLVYLNKKDGANAAVEFRKIVEHGYLFANTPTFAVSQLGLARAYVLQGDFGKARTAYQDFFASWKDADPDLTPLKQSKAEYGKLQ
jgi:hypothetical protein